MNDVLRQLKSMMKAKGPLSPAAYELTRPNKSSISQLPFADFYELEPMLRKFSLGDEGLNVDSLGDNKKHGVMPLYGGIVNTMSKIVSNLYFVYSATLVQSHITMARLGLKYKCGADLPSLSEVELSREDRRDLYNTLLAVDVAARIAYEGDGLGGYKDKSWLLYGKIYGEASPEAFMDPQYSGLTREQAQAEAQKVAQFDAESYSKADGHGKQAMFIRWWNELHGELGLSDDVLARLHRGFRLVATYSAIEKGSLQFNPADKNHLISVLCGYARRTAKGIVRSKSNSGSKAPAFYQLLWDYQTGAVIPQARELLTSTDGGLTPFGNRLLRTVELYVLREDVTYKSYPGDYDDDF